MNPPSTLRLTLTDAYGKTETLGTDAARLLVGSGAHCDVRVHGPGVGREHVLLEQTPLGVVATVHPTLPSAALDGAPFRRARFAPGVKLTFAGVSLHYTRVEAPPKRSGSRLRTVASVALLVLLAPAAALGAVGARGGKRAEVEAPEPPSLAPSGPAQCDAVGPAALSSAMASARAGSMARERYPFAAEEGARALADFSRAEACFMRAGRGDLAQGSRDLSASLGARIAQDVHVHHARLLHAIETDDVTHARREVRAQKALMRGQSGAYVDWLDLVDRRLEVAEQKKVKKPSRF
ncbi:MAG: hypothetical protein JNL38_19830 [Myxococcales bacterium]|jgi:hypothetical protein|nr:hypothetical protein [Myxococcales bacterium]